MWFLSNSDHSATGGENRPPASRDERPSVPGTGEISRCSYRNVLSLNRPRHARVTRTDLTRFSDVPTRRPPWGSYSNVAGLFVNVIVVHVVRMLMSRQKL